MSQQKEQDIFTENKLSGDRQTPRKRIQNNYNKDDSGSQEKKNGEDARNVYQIPRRTKEQTDEQYTGGNQQQHN